MLERPPGGATMRWPVRLGLLSSIWAPERHRADHLSPAPLAPPEGRAGALSSPASGMLSPNLGWVQAPRPPWGSLLSALCPWGPGITPLQPRRHRAGSCPTSCPGGVGAGVRWRLLRAGLALRRGAGLGARSSATSSYRRRNLRLRSCFLGDTPRRREARILAPTGLSPKPTLLTHRIAQSLVLKTVLCVVCLGERVCICVRARLRVCELLDGMTPLICSKQICMGAAVRFKSAKPTVLSHLMRSHAVRSRLTVPAPSPVSVLKTS